MSFLRKYLPWFFKEEPKQEEEPKQTQLEGYFTYIKYQLINYKTKSRYKTVIESGYPTTDKLIYFLSTLASATTDVRELKIVLSEPKIKERILLDDFLTIGNRRIAINEIVDIISRKITRVEKNIMESRDRYYIESIIETHIKEICDLIDSVCGEG